MNEPDVNINISELLAAFAQENATLTQRAVIAEQKAKALQGMLRQQAEQHMRNMQAVTREPVSEETVSGEVVDPAVAEVTEAPRKRAARKRTA